MNRSHTETESRFPVPVTILVTDVEAFGRLANPQQVAVRDSVYAVLGRAFATGGVPWSAGEHEDRGDGVLMIIPASVPKALVVSRVLPQIVAGLAVEREAGLPPVRLRLAAHAGDAHRDGHGFAGADVNLAFRLVNSAILRQALRATAAPCAILLSDALYQATARHGYDGIDAGAYHPLPVRTKEDDVTGWLTIPGDDACARRLSAGTPAAPSAATELGGVRINATGDVSIRGGIIAGRDAHGPVSR